MTYMVYFIYACLLSVSQTCSPPCGPSEICGNSTEGGGPTCLGEYVYLHFKSYKFQSNLLKVIKKDCQMIHYL